MGLRLKKIIGAGNCVVDLGCGSGHLLSDLSGSFEKRIDLDVSRRRLEEMAGGKTEGWDFREADPNGVFPLQDASADVVIANQVIEHIIDPVKFCQEIHRVLKPEGRCVITTPNIPYLKNIAHLLFSGYGPRTAGGNTLDGAWDDGHVHYFTHKDLHEIFQHAGFRQVSSQGLIGQESNGQLRRWMDRCSHACPVREFLSGCILLSAVK